MRCSTFSKSSWSSDQSIQYFKHIWDNIPGSKTNPSTFTESKHTVHDPLPCASSSKPSWSLVQMIYYTTTNETMSIARISKLFWSSDRVGQWPYCPYRNETYPKKSMESIDFRVFKMFYVRESLWWSYHAIFKINRSFHDNLSNNYLRNFLEIMHII